MCFPRVFISLAIMSYEPLYDALKYSKRTRDFFGRFHFYFVLVFFIFGAFLLKQLFHSCLLDMR